MTLFCVNRHLNRDFASEIRLTAFAPVRKAQVQTLSALSIYQGNYEMHPDAVRPVDRTIEVPGPNFAYIFPHSSVTTIELKRK